MRTALIKDIRVHHLKSHELMPSVPATSDREDEPSKLVELNVGGVTYTTSFGTLMMSLK